MKSDRASPHGSVLFIQLPDEQQSHRRPGSCDVDDRVPEAHQGENDARSVGKGERDKRGVDEGIDSVY